MQKLSCRHTHTHTHTAGAEVAVSNVIVNLHRSETPWSGKDNVKTCMFVDNRIPNVWQIYAACMMVTEELITHAI